MSYEPAPTFSPVVAPEKRPSGPLWNTAAAAVIALLAVAFIVVCAARLYALSKLASDLSDISADPASLALTHLKADSDSVHSTLDLYQAALFPMYLAFVIWNIVLPKRLKEVGQTHSLRGLTAWKVWRISVFVSLATVIFAASKSTFDDPAEAASYYHREMAYCAVRLVIGFIYLWVIYSIWKTTSASFAAGVKSTAARPEYRLPEINPAFTSYPPVQQYAPPVQQYAPPVQPYTPPTNPYVPPAPPTNVN